MITALLQSSRTVGSRNGRAVLDMLDRLVRADDGQDLVEYALITAFVGVAGYLVLRTMRTDIFNTYSSWLDPKNPKSVPGLWDPPEPISSGS